MLGKMSEYMSGYIFFEMQWWGSLEVKSCSICFHWFNSHLSLWPPPDQVWFGSRKILHTSCFSRQSGATNQDVKSWGTLWCFPKGTPSHHPIYRWGCSPTKNHPAIGYPATPMTSWKPPCGYVAHHSLKYPAAQLLCLPAALLRPLGAAERSELEVSAAEWPGWHCWPPQQCMIHLVLRDFPGHGGTQKWLVWKIHL